MKNGVLSLLFLFGLISSNVNGQTTVNEKLIEPEVGKPCPEFAFDKIDFYSKKHVTLNDFKGKWIVLDFWSKNCSGCIASFPKINSEQKEFKDSIQFLMVAGKNENEERPLYSSYYKNLHLEMPCAFDSNLFKSFNVGLLPHIIIVDPKGIVRVITMSHNASKLAELLDGKSPMFITANFDHGHDEKKKSKYNGNLPFLIQGNGGVDSNFIYRSMLSNWTPDIPVYRSNAMIHSEVEHRVLHNKGRFELCGAFLSLLYRAAYTGNMLITMADSAFYGKVWPNPILEIQDSTLFDPDIATGRGVYCYSLVVPPARAKREYMMGIMQNDLRNYFGYNVSIQVRKMPYWKVVATDQAKKELRSKGDGPRVRTESTSWNEISFKNEPILDFIKEIGQYSGVTNEYEPILDETGIKGPVDITVNWFKNDFNSVHKALKKNGLDLIKGEKEMKVLIIKDLEKTRQTGFLDLAD